MTIGRRIYSQENGHVSLQEGDYGFDQLVGHWLIRPPNCHAGGIPNHTIVEHEDGTITVSPSILHYGIDDEGNQKVDWHGYLERGIWREI